MPMLDLNQLNEPIDPQDPDHLMTRAAAQFALMTLNAQSNLTREQEQKLFMETFTSKLKELRDAKTAL